MIQNRVLITGVPRQIGALLHDIDHLDRKGLLGCKSEGAFV